jgi:Fe-S-cluster-containing hydrogenase component 2
MNGQTDNLGNTEIYEESINRLVSADVIKNSALSEELLKKYQNIVKSNKHSPKQAIIEPHNLTKAMNTKDKLKFFTRILPKALSSVRNAKISFKDLQKNPEMPTKLAGPEFIRDFENYAYYLGIGKIGYTKITPNLVFQDSSVLFPNVIVLMYEMNKDLIQKAPSFDTFKMIMGTYKELNQHTNFLANFLRRKNFAAQAGPALGGVSNYVVMAKNANFGWVGKHGLLITPEFGPRIRLSVIFTNIQNLPISQVDKDNSHSWIESFCKKCSECVNACPGGAILTKPIITKKTQYTHINNKNCYPYFYNQYGCTLCIKSCPFSYRDYKELRLEV